MLLFWQFLLCAYYYVMQSYKYSLYHIGLAVLFLRLHLKQTKTQNFVVSKSGLLMGSRISNKRYKLLYKPYHVKKGKKKYHLENVKVT